MNDISTSCSSPGNFKTSTRQHIFCALKGSKSQTGISPTRLVDVKLLQPGRFRYGYRKAVNLMVEVSGNGIGVGKEWTGLFGHYE